MARGFRLLLRAGLVSSDLGRNGSCETQHSRQYGAGFALQCRIPSAHLTMTHGDADCGVAWSDTHGGESPPIDLLSSSPNKILAVIGLGYACPPAVEFGKHRPVVGFDVGPRRVEELKAGHDRTLEVDTKDL